MSGRRAARSALVFGQGQGRAHAEAHRLVGVHDRVASRVGPGRGIGRGRQLAQLDLVAATGQRPQRQAAGRATGALDEGFRQRDQRLELAKMGKANGGLPGRHDLPWLDRRGRDDSLCIRFERRVIERVVGELAPALGPGQPSARLRPERARLVEHGRRTPSFLMELRRPHFVGFELHQARGSGSHLGIGLFELELEIVGVEPEQRLPPANAIPVLDEPLRDLAAHPETEIALYAWADRRREGVRLRHALVLDRGDQNRARGRLLGCWLLGAVGIAAPTSTPRTIEANRQKRSAGGGSPESSSKQLDWSMAVPPA